jgi:hypothetical protein
VKTIADIRKDLPLSGKLLQHELAIHHEGLTNRIIGSGMN